jgi:hypothetical protein
MAVTLLTIQCVGCGNFVVVIVLCIYLNAKFNFYNSSVTTEIERYNSSTIIIYR